MIHGSCLCGTVSFSLDGQLRGVRYCHCANCRKFAGTSPATWAMADASKLLLTAPDAQVGRFNSGRGIRCFCLACGSPVWFESIDYPEIIGIPLGVIDEGEHPAPKTHLWVRSKPGWYEILDDLERHEGGPE
jgi:hypothetical protein